MTSIPVAAAQRAGNIKESLEQICLVADLADICGLTGWQRTKLFARLQVFTPLQDFLYS